MTLRVRTVDAFTDHPFSGNPAGVVRLDDQLDPPSETWCASVAAELNLSETAFLFALDHADGGDGSGTDAIDGPDTIDGTEAINEPEADFELRWFTPTAEVDLCGHATLAMSHALFCDGVPGPIRYRTRSGVLTVGRNPDGSMTMDFPAQPPTRLESPSGLADALGVQVGWCGVGGGDYLIELADAATVRRLAPDLAAIGRLPVRGVIVTAVSDVADADFVSRFFGPAVGVPEDPVTGSAHTVLGPYWAAKLGRTELTGLQVSTRSGRVGVRVDPERVHLTGRAVTVIDGVLTG